MKFSEDVLKEFNLTPEEEKEPVNIMQISEMLQFLKAMLPCGIVCIAMIPLSFSGQKPRKFF